ncbi:MAG: aldo/keto reductase [Balneolales bacterium]|nr:aldo/keto reductase [Balneolales bacterium]
MQSKMIQGVEVPEIGLGTYKLIGKTGEEVIKQALRMGYRHIDTAQNYLNEKEVGNAIQASRIPREELFVTTKIDRFDLEPDKFLKAAEQSLLDLKMNYVDLLLIHWPNPEVEIRRTLEAMLSLRDQGKAVHIGVSNFPMSLMQEIIEELNAPIFCNQVEYHALLGQFDLLDYAAEHDVMVTAYSPLGQGKLITNPLLLELGQKYGKSSAQIALRWLVEQEQVVAIPKASSAERLQQNMDIYDFELEDADFYAIDDLDKNMRFINPGFAPDWNS